MDVMEYVQNCFKLYLGEDSAYKYIDKKVEWLTAFFVVLGISLVSNAITFVVNKTPLVEIGMGFLVAILSICIGSFLGYGIIHLFFKLFGGQADFENLLKFGFSLGVFPSLLYILLAFIPQTMLESNTILLIVVGVFTLALAIWSIVISVRTYAKLEKLSYGRTFLALILPIIIVLVLVIIVGVLFFMYNTTSGVIPIQ